MIQTALMYAFLLWPVNLLNVMPYILLLVSNNLPVKGTDIPFTATVPMQFAYIVGNFIFLAEEVLLNTITPLVKDMLY